MELLNAIKLVLYTKFSSNTMFKYNTTKFIGLALILLAIVVGFVTRIIFIFRYTTFDIGPDPDQIRDAFVYMNMWQGNLPHLGPRSSVGQYNLPPLYYYLVFPFTIFGADPAFQALANGMFSFASILLLMYLVYKLLDNLNSSKRLMLSGLAGFWYSTIFPEIFISNFNWNPSPIPFFFISFVLLYQYQLENNSPWLTQAACWIIYGIFLAILVSLHSTTLFIMPVVFIVSSLWFIYRKRKERDKWVFPLISVISANVSLFLYWKLELVRGFINTKRIFNLIFSSSQSSNSFLEKFKVILDYFNLGQQAYFIGDHWYNLAISIIFLLLVTLLGIIKFRGNKVIFFFLIFTWLTFLYAASNYQETYFFIPYKLLILFAPIILAVSALGYSNFSRRFNKILNSLIIGLIFLSILINSHLNLLYFSSKYGQERVMAVSDITNIFQQIPAKSTICYPEKEGKRKRYNQYDYIDTYITQKDFKITKDCYPGNYVLHPKFKMAIPLNNWWPLFTIIKNPMFSEKSRLFLETSVVSVYILE